MEQNPGKAQPRARVGRRHPNNLQTHFLLKVWLDDILDRLAANDTSALGHLDEIQDAVDAWLRSSTQRSQASFVLTAWLNVAAAVKGDRAGAMVSLVQHPVEAWLAVEGRATDEVAGFLYPAWLNAAAAVKGDRAVAMVSLVQHRVEAWLAVEGQATDEVAGFVYPAWLNAAAAVKGDRAVAMVSLVEAYVAAWVDVNATLKETHFVYTSWLEGRAWPSSATFLWGNLSVDFGIC